MTGIGRNHRQASYDWLRPGVAVLFVAGLLVGAPTAFAEDPESTPVQAPSEEPGSFETLDAGEPDSVVQGHVPAPQALVGPAANLVTLGLDFETSRLFNDSGFIPPDTMGAVGNDHIVEIINGNFEIFNKTDGTTLDSRSLNSFWVNTAGVAIPASTDICNVGAGTCSFSGNACTVDSDCLSNFTFDPRIVYDPVTSTWFASSLDRDFGAGNNLFLARTDSDDPTGPWQGVVIDAETVGNPEFHDYETLAVDADGLFMCTQDFGDGGNESCYSIPKADLLLSPPSVANLTRFEATPAGLDPVSGAWQPALDFGASDGRAALIGSDGANLLRTDILGAGAAGATLGTAVGIAGDPGHSGPPAARQPHPADPTVTLENVAPRFVGNVFEEGDSLWMVHAVEGSSGNNSALRWYEVDETSDTVIQTGLIDDPDEDYHEPSIAVNEFGNVVIGYTCSGPDLAPSVCISVGETAGGVTTFEDPTVVAAGAGHYYRDFRGPDGTPTRNRWGDYSATVIDPVDPCTFWTFQEFVAVSAAGDVGPSPRLEGGNWGTQVSEITFTDCAEADLVVFKSDNPDPVAAGADLTYTISVENLGPSRAHNVVVTDPLPAGTAFDSAGGTDWSCAEAGGTVTCDWQGGNPAGSLANGETTGDIDIVVTVDADFVFNGGSQLSNTASVASDTTDPDAANDSDTEVTDVIAVTDLEILRFEAIDPPTEITVGVDVPLTLEKDITNNGPSGPVDVDVTVTATAAPGTTVVPPVDNTTELALDVDEERTLEENFTLSCQEASNHSFTFDNEILPIDADDPDLSNNTAQVVVDVICVVPVTINIKPGSNPNSIQTQRGTIPVAILTTAAGEGGNPLAFDATAIDPLSVRFGPADEVNGGGGAAERHNRGHIEDSFELDENTKDGDLDMVLHFRAAETGVEADDTELCVKGEFTDASGTHLFFGCDAVRIVPPNK